MTFRMKSFHKPFIIKPFKPACESVIYTCVANCSRSRWCLSQRWSDLRTDLSTILMMCEGRATGAQSLGLLKTNTIGRHPEPGQLLHSLMGGKHRARKTRASWLEHICYTWGRFLCEDYPTLSSPARLRYGRTIGSESVFLLENWFS